MNGDFYHNELIASVRMRRNCGVVRHICTLSSVFRRDWPSREIFGQAQRLHNYRFQGALNPLLVTSEHLFAWARAFLDFLQSKFLAKAERSLLDNYVRVG